MYLYLITNLKNNKKYVGITSNYNDRMSYHKTRAFQPAHKEYEKPLYRAFRKHGTESFKFEILQKDLSVEEAKSLEIETIANLNTLTRNNFGYNITEGGDHTMARGEDHHNVKLTEEDARDIISRRKNGESRSEVYKLYSHKIGLAGFINVWQGRTWSHIDPMFSNRVKDGRKGANNPHSVLDEQEVIKIRTYKKEGHRRIDVYRAFIKHKEISEATFNRVWYNYNYKNIVV